MKIVFKNYWKTKGLFTLASVELLTLYNFSREYKVFYFKLFNFGITIFFNSYKNGR